MIEYNPKASLSSLVFLFILGALFAFKKCSNTSKYQNKNEGKQTSYSGTSSINNIQEALQAHELIYTKHARCRMECRDISETEVQDILQHGKINPSKSNEDQGNNECPTYALEGNSTDGQHLRIVFASCEQVTKVVTCIDIGVEHHCNCK